MNPLIQQVTQSALNSAFSNPSINSMLKTIKAAHNPTQALTDMAQGNPALQGVLNMCQGRNPRDVFYEECLKRGINPDDILRNLM